MVRGDPVLTRGLPDYYVPDKESRVDLSANPGSGALAWVIEDSPPAEWIVTSMSSGGVFDTVNKKVKWGLFMDNIPRDFYYYIKPPAGEKKLVNFTGLISVDGHDYATTGDSSLENGPELLLKYLLGRIGGRAIDANQDTDVDIGDLVFMIKKP